MNDSISTFFAKFMFILMLLGWLTACSSIEPNKPKKCPPKTYTMAELMPVESGYSIGILGAEWFGK